MVNTSKHPNINLYTYSEVVEFSGLPGKYNIKIKKHPRFVDEKKCTGCGLCTTKCPIKVPNEFNRGIGERGAIYIPFPQAVPKYAVIDKDVCIPANAVIGYDIEEDSKRFTVTDSGIVVVPKGTEIK